MDTVGVVVAQIGAKVALEGGELGDERPGEGSAAALFEDGALDAFDTAVGLGSASMGEALLSPGGGDGLAKELGAELGAVVGGDPFEGPTGPSGGLRPPERGGRR